jgi:hypothetical protein
MNGFDYNPVLDQISFSSPLRTEWYVIDHSTTTAEAATHSGGKGGKGGDILFRYGNPTNYGVPSGTVLTYNHDAHWIKEGCPDAGMMSGFCNSCAGAYATIDHVITPRVGFTYTHVPNAAFTPTTYNSRYVCPNGGGGWGNSEQFPNGNQMAELGTSGGIIEVSQAGVMTWSYQTAGGWSAQVHRYTPCYITGTAPATPSITPSGSLLIATGAVTYQWYFNGTAIPSGTNQILPCPFGQDGYYQVRVLDVAGCIFAYSGHLYFSPPAPPPPVSLAELNAVAEKLSLFPNPTNGKIQLMNEGNLPVRKVEVYSSEGKLLQSFKDTEQMNIEQNNPGLYFIEIYCGEISVKKKLSLVK